MPDLLVVEQLRDYLIAQGVGQAWSTPASAVRPGIILNPVDGAPYPRKTSGETATVTLREQSSSSALEGSCEETFVDVLIRAVSSPAAKLLHRTIFGLIEPVNAMGGRKNWTMGSLHVEYSLEWRGEQTLPADTSERVVTVSRSYLIAARRKALAGTPEVP